MYSELTPMGIKVPNGFAVTAEAYRDILEQADAWAPLHEALDGLETEDIGCLASRAARAREIVYRAPLPVSLQQEILTAYRRLQEEYGSDLASLSAVQRPPRIYPMPVLPDNTRRF